MCYFTILDVISLLNVWSKKICPVVLIWESVITTVSCDVLQFSDFRLFDTVFLAYLSMDFKYQTN